MLAARYQLDGMPVLRMGSREQAVLARRGDDVRIDWGYLYLAADKSDGVTTFAGDRAQARAAFDADRAACRSPTSSARFAAAVRCWLLRLRSAKSMPRRASRYLMLAYDDLYSIEYFERKERAWWRRNGATAADMLRSARRDHDALADPRPALRHRTHGRPAQDRRR